MLQKIGPGPLPPTSFPIHYSWIILPFDGVRYAISTQTFSTPQISRSNKQINMRDFRLSPRRAKNLDPWRWNLRGCPEKSVMNYHHSLCNIIEQWGSQTNTQINKSTQTCFTPFSFTPLFHSLIYALPLTVSRTLAGALAFVCVFLFLMAISFMIYGHSFKIITMEYNRPWCT